MNKKILTFFVCLSFLNSCQSIKDGLTGKKQENSDEFLVIKKNPLEVPPDFNDLPIPKSEKKESETEAIDEEIEDLIKSINSAKENNPDSKNTSAEEFVIKKINKN
tara:strand:+ start:426 stop:743 length:318 start_codon:yes stop_codon:yes gene_type:complete